VGILAERAGHKTAAIGPYSGPVTLSKIDGRTKEARLIRETRAELTAHVGGKPSATQRQLIERVCQLTLRVCAMDRKFADAGAHTLHDTNQYLAWSNSLGRALRDLGMKAAVNRSTPGLQEYLAARTTAA